MKIRGWSFLQIWALLLISAALLMGSLAVFTFGAVCFAGLFALWLKACSKARAEPLHIINGIMLFLCVIWFLVNILVEFFPNPAVFTLLFVLAYQFPGLILNLHYLENREFLVYPRVWKFVLSGLYALGISFSLFIFCLIAGWVRLEDMRQASFLLMILMSLLFAISGTGSAIILSRAPSKDSKVYRESKRVNLFLLGSMVFLFAMIILVHAEEVSDLTSFLSIVSRSLPLIFLFVNSYYENRFDFYDVFVKRATLFFIVLMVLVGYFILLAPWVTFGRDLDASLHPWIHSLLLLPFVLSVPWIYRKLEELLDEYWLGRQYSSVDAVKLFLAGVRKATTRDELIRRGSSIISKIFQASVVIQLERGETGRVDFEAVQRVQIPSHGNSGGEILLGPRPNQTPYFAGDLTLVRALAEVLSFLLQNQWLQEKKQEQEKREQALILDASRSELKALRAQINPHFLFNSLNAIASLTQRDPDWAEETVEQLAEVFRYTLSRSEQEWVRMSDEFEFIRSYLEIEKARFGERLEVKLDLEEELEEVLIPTMLVQTLVENAVKHGVSMVSGRARIEVQAHRKGRELVLQVRDNGPGLEHRDSKQALRRSRERPGGYGLKNIRDRLEGYFGGEASFSLVRDSEDEMTIARIRFPFALSKRSAVPQSELNQQTADG